MKTIIIKQSLNPGKDAQTFRAYEEAVPKDRSLGISSSTTGNAVCGALRCAAKAFQKFTEPGGDLDEIETRIKLKQIPGFDIWRAELQPK